MKGFWAVAIVLTVAGTFPVYSQTSSTAVLGTVTDATGAVLVGAKVTSSAGEAEAGSGGDQPAEE